MRGRKTSGCEADICFQPSIHETETKVPKGRWQRKLLVSVNEEEGKQAAAKQTLQAIPEGCLP